MKKPIILSILLLAIILIVILTRESIPKWDGLSVTSNIPHPLSEYDLSVYDGTPDQVFNTVMKKYSVPVIHKDNSYPIEPNSYAVFISKELREANIYRQNLEDEEKEKILHALREGLMRVMIDIDLILYSTEYDYINIDDSWLNNDNKSLFIETSQGDIIKPFQITKFPERSSSRSIHAMAVVLYFPQAQDDKDYINEETEWIRLWIEKNDAAVCFFFDFQTVE